MNRREFSKALCQCGAGLAMTVGAWDQVQAQAKSNSAKKQPAKPQTGNGKPAAQKSDDWVTYQSPHGDFTIRFPNQPRVKPSEKDGISPAYISEQGDHLFLAQAYRGSPLETGWTQKSLANFLREGKGIESWQLLSTNILEYRAVLSRNAETGLTKPALARTHIYPGLIYVLIAGVNEEGKTLDVTLAKKFLNSFQFTLVEAAQTPQRPSAPQPQSSTCTSCHGTGRKFCYYCAGTGKTSPSMVSVEGYWCRFCNRQGYTRCQQCGGRGRI